MKRRLVVLAATVLATVGLPAPAARADAEQAQHLLDLLHADGVPVADNDLASWDKAGATICTRLESGDSLDQLAGRLTALPSYHATLAQATRLVLDARTVYCPSVLLN